MILLGGDECNKSITQVFTLLFVIIIILYNKDLQFILNQSCKKKLKKRKQGKYEEKLWIKVYLKKIYKSWNENKKQ